MAAYKMTTDITKNRNCVSKNGMWSLHVGHFGICLVYVEKNGIGYMDGI